MSPVGTPWMWTVSYGFHEDHTPTHGYKPTREAAMAACAARLRGASTPELRPPVVALSLGGLRRRIEIAMLPDDVDVVLQLDGFAERNASARTHSKKPERSLTPIRCTRPAYAATR